MMTCFSVIIPVYNAADTIERCVESIIAGGADDIQIILIEDCSSDNSWDVCVHLSQKYESVHCLRNDKNRGVSYTRNRGIAEATGDYILFADSDDWVDPAYVSVFRQAVCGGAILAVCGYVNHDEKYNQRTDVVVPQGVKGITSKPLREEIENLYCSNLLQQLWNKLFKASVVKERNITFDESISIGEDTRFVLDYIERGDIADVALIDQPLYHYMRDQDGSLMFRVGYESVEEPLKNLRKLYAIMGLEAAEIEQRLSDDRQQQIRLYAYLIMHNAGMTMREKRRLILALDEKHGKKLYWDNVLVYIKERLAKRMK